MADILKDTHYAFIHAQPTSMTTMVYLINQLTKLDGLPKSRLFKYVRLPKDISQTELKRRVSAVQQMKMDINDTHPDIRDIMVSTDADFKHRAIDCSARHFLFKNSAFINDRIELVHKILSGRSDIPQGAVKNIKNLVNLFYDENEACCGNLFVFFVPKNLLKNADDPNLVAYSSHIYGKKCTCHPHETDIQYLEKLQNKELNKEKYCQGESNHGIPQFRLIIPNLTPEQGVMCVMLTPFTKELRKELKEMVSDRLTHDNPKTTSLNLKR